MRHSLREGEFYSPNQDPGPGHQQWSTSPLLHPYSLLSLLLDMSTDIWESNRVWGQPVWPETGNQQLFFQEQNDVGLIQGSRLMLPAGCPALLYKPRGVSQLHLQFLLGKGGKVWMSSSCPDRKGWTHIQSQRHPGRGGVSIFAREPPNSSPVKTAGGSELFGLVT